MDVRGRAEVGADVDRVLPVVSDLATYPSWLGIVSAARPEPPDPGDAGPAWAVDLVGRLGPLTRTKRVRMQRSDEEGGPIRFVRRELDSRAHPEWIFEVELSSAGPGRTSVAVRLHYSGAPSLPGVDVLLGREVARAGARLDALVARP